MTEPLETGRRKLTTVLCADAVGFSAMTERDEAGTLAGLKADRQVMTAVIERQHGRVVNTWGDGLLAEFESPVEAVAAAAEIQRSMRARPETSGVKLVHRIGINLGDVILDGTDLLGDGVNVAARLQGEADPGGICISRTVYDQVGNKLSLGFQFLGEHAVKNLTMPVPVYRVLLDRSVADDQPGVVVRDGTPVSKPGSAPIPGDDGRAWFDWRWRRDLYRGLGLIALLFVINLVTGNGHWWFKYPAIAIAFALAWRWVRWRAQRDEPPRPGHAG